MLFGSIHQSLGPQRCRRVGTNILVEGIIRLLPEQLTKQAHSGSIWKVAWAHPEFGQLIASCSFDRTVCIWEEEEDHKWTKRATLVDSRDSVLDIKFAPRHLGLKLVRAPLPLLFLSFTPSGHLF